MGGESRGMFDLRKQFVFYASYHNQPVNVAIHLVCIWNLREFYSVNDQCMTMMSMLSVWSGMVLMHHSPQLATAPDLLTKVMMMMMTILTIMMTVPQVPLIGGTPVNLTLLVTLIYVVSYVAMDPVAGSLAAGLVLLLHRWTAGGSLLL